MKEQRERGSDCMRNFNCDEKKSETKRRGCNYYSLLLSMDPRPSSSSSHKGKGKATDQDSRPDSLLSNSNRSLPKQDDSYVPPAKQLKKYVYAQPHILQKHSNPKKNRDKKLGHHLAHLTSTATTSAQANYEHDHLLLNQDNGGLMEAENDLERTWRITQDEIVKSSAVATKGKQFSLELEEFGPYAVDYTRNGR